mmetsp:Transcript_11907/g.19412  ORF Transcript_11907/g.19412 Transcript_11907/m.19412 type:complete len:115 (+) Transcript_11907:56-400(+)
MLVLALYNTICTTHTFGEGFAVNPGPLSPSSFPTCLLDKKMFVIIMNSVVLLWWRISCSHRPLIRFATCMESICTCPSTRLARSMCKVKTAAKNHITAEATASLDPLSKRQGYI